MTHGIAHVLDGGTIRVPRRAAPATAARSSSRTRAIRIGRADAAPASAWRTSGRGCGALYGADATVDAARRDGVWRVGICHGPAIEPNAGDGREPMTDRPLRVVIVDDEPLARAVVREYPDAHPGVEIVAECAQRLRGGEGGQRADSPTWCLLDVQMPKLDGFEVLELLGRDVPVIFMTAYDQYALRAFEVHAVDYLLKPFSAERLGGGAVAGARRGCGARETPVAGRRRRCSSARRGRGPGPLERVLIRDGAQVHVIPVDTHRLRRGAGRLRRVQVRTGSVPEGADAGGGRGVARSGAVRPHPPVVSAQHRAHRARRAVREGQPHRDSARRHASCR